MTTIVVAAAAFIRRRDRVVVGNTMTVSVADCNQEANMCATLHYNSIMIIFRARNDRLTPSRSCGPACLRLPQIAGALDCALRIFYRIVQCLRLRSGGSPDAFWPNVARKTQAVVDAVMQVACLWR